MFHFEDGPCGDVCVPQRLWLQEAISLSQAQTKSSPRPFPPQSTCPASFSCLIYTICTYPMENNFLSCIPKTTPLPKPALVPSKVGQLVTLSLGLTSPSTHMHTWQIWKHLQFLKQPDFLPEHSPAIWDESSFFAPSCHLILCSRSPPWYVSCSAHLPVTVSSSPCLSHQTD